MAISFKRRDLLVSPEGREFLVDSITFDKKVLLQRLDRQPREHLRVWKDLADVSTWERK